MGKFKIGDRIVNRHGETATVVDSSEILTIDWDAGVMGFVPASAFKLLARKFTTGQYVRVVDTDDDFAGVVGFIYEDDGDEEENMPYAVALFDDFGTEENFSASELIPWVPFVGEHVIEANNEAEEDEIGVVVSSDPDNGRVRVLWESFPLAQDWPVSDLEPADEDEFFSEGDVVVYNNPLFTTPARAKVVAVEGNVLRVNFEIGSIFADGNYPTDFFSFAA